MSEKKINVESQRLKGWERDGVGERDGYEEKRKERKRNKFGFFVYKEN